MTQSQSAQSIPSKISKLRSVTVATTATGLAGQTALLISGPLLARMLGLDGRGQLAALLLWPTVIALLGSLGLPSAITYFIAQRRASTKAVCRAALPFAVPPALLLVVIHAGILSLALHDEPASIKIAGAITLGAVPAHLAQLYGLAILQGHQRFTLFNFLRLLPAVLFAGGVLALFAVGNQQIVSVVVLWMAATVMVGISTLTISLWTTRDAHAEAQAVERKELVRFGVRGLFGSVSPIEHFRIDQLVLAIFLAPAALGLYVVGLAFTNVFRFLSQSVGMVAYPSIAAHTDPSSARRTLWAFIWATVALSVVFVIPLMLAVGWLVRLLFGQEFGEAVLIARILLAGMVFASGRRILSDGLKGRGYPAAGTLAEIAALLWLAPALGAMVPLWGAPGAAVALSSSYVVSLVALLVLAARRGEARLAAVFGGPPLTAWNRLRLFSLSKVS